MSSLAMILSADAGRCHPSGAQRDYVPMIIQAMAEKGMGQRALALKTGISKTKLGLLLHHDQTKRASMSLTEFQIILTALDINIIQAIISVESFHDLNILQDARFGTLIAMLGELYRGLPSMLVTALDELEGLDGTEVRMEWAEPLTEALVKRLVKEVSFIMERRSILSEVRNLGI